MTGTPVLPPIKTAVLVVDMQNDFCHPEGAFVAGGRDVSTAIAMAPRLESFLNEARAHRVHVVFIRTTHDETTDTKVWLERTSRARATKPSTCRTDTWGADFYQVSPKSGEPVIVKHRYSAFTETSLNIVLRAAGITSLLVTGVATEVCVESTLRDGLSHDYHMTLVEDCCASYSEDAHNQTIANVRDNFGFVVNSEDIRSAWRQDFLET